MKNWLFIGAGNMGGAVLRGLYQSSFLDSEHIAFMELADSLAEKITQETQAQRFLELEQAVKWAEVIVLGIKPQGFGKFSQSLAPLLNKQHAVVSLMAGVSLKQLDSSLQCAQNGATSVRTMPNLPMMAGYGAMGLAEDNLSAEQKNYFCEAFAKISYCSPCAESQLDAVTGLSGSGPAWVFQFLEGMISGGVHAGIPRPEAEKLTYATVEGCLKLLQQSDIGPAEWISKVCSPGGTTIYGLNELEKGAVKHHFIQAVQSATNRSKELGK